MNSKKYKPSAHDLLEYLNTQPQTEKFCLSAVINYPFLIENVKNKTEKICLAAIDSDPVLLFAIEEEKQTPTVCLTAVSKYPKSIKHVKKQTDYLRLLAVNKDPFALEFVEKQTMELCEMAIKAEPASVRCINFDLKTPAETEYLVLLAIKSDLSVISSVDQRVLTFDLCKKILDNIEDKDVQAVINKLTTGPKTPEYFLDTVSLILTVMSDEYFTDKYKSKFDEVFKYINTEDAQRFGYNNSHIIKNAMAKLTLLNEIDNQNPYAESSLNTTKYKNRII